MNVNYQILQAEIDQDLQTISETYKLLADIMQKPATVANDIVLAYYLHVLYGLFENIFGCIAENFGNHVQDKLHHPAQLLRRMTLDLPSLRPPIIQRETYHHLNELRKFRHLFRNAYLLNFDSKRLRDVYQHAQALQPLYLTDFDRFKQFLAQLSTD